MSGACPSHQSIYEPGFLPAGILLRRQVRNSSVVLTIQLIERNIGVPHMTSEEDVYGGYYIPKGALVMANT